MKVTTLTHRAVVSLEGWNKPKLIINIKGTNGSGKSTIANSLIRGENTIRIVDDNQYWIATLNNDLKILAIGRYDKSQMTGCDRLKGNRTQIENILMELWNTPYDILIEGIIISDIRFTYWNFIKVLTAMKRETHPRIPKFIFLDTPLNVCIERVYNRNNGNKKIKTELIEGKYKNINRQIKHYSSLNENNVFRINTCNSPRVVAGGLLNKIKEWRNE